MIMADGLRADGQCTDRRRRAPLHVLTISSPCERDGLCYLKRSEDYIHFRP